MACWCITTGSSLFFDKRSWARSIPGIAAFSIHKCRKRAQQSVWWPGISQQLEDFIHSCPHGCEEHPSSVERLIPAEFCTLMGKRWQQTWLSRNGSTGSWQLSQYILIACLPKEASAEVIHQVKIIVACHGIQRKVISNNGPQFVSWEFSKLAKVYDFVHTTNSPRCPHSYGETERALWSSRQVSQYHQISMNLLFKGHITLPPERGRCKTMLRLKCLDYTYGYGASCKFP